MSSLERRCLRIRAPAASGYITCALTPVSVSCAKPRPSMVVWRPPSIDDDSLAIPSIAKNFRAHCAERAVDHSKIQSTRINTQLRERQTPRRPSVRLGTSWSTPAPATTKMPTKTRLPSESRLLVQVYVPRSGFSLRARLFIARR